MIVYDIECIRPVMPRDPDQCLPDIEYAKDWKDYLGMGIACIGAYDAEADLFRVFGGDPPELDRFGAFAANRIIVGWNNRAFDDPLLAAHGVDVVQSWDIKAALMAAGGGGQRGNSLEDTARVNLGGTGKFADGSMAPVWWQRGQHERVIDYCLQDVNLTRRLLCRLLNRGEITAAATGKPVRPAIPLEILHAHERHAAAVAA